MLVVDDDQEMVEFLCSLIESEFGVRTAIARDGAEALQRIQALRPSVVLLDLFLPEVDGFEVCRRLRNSPDTRAIPVVAITGLPERGLHRQKAIEAGCASFVHKLYDFHLLLPILGRHLGFTEFVD